MPPASRSASAPSGRRGQAAREVHQPGDRDGQGGEADRHAVGGLHEVGVAQQPHAEAEQHEGQHEADPPERAGDHRVHGVPDDGPAAPHHSRAATTMARP